MSISNWSASQFENMNSNNLRGVTLVYARINAQGERHESAVNFQGENYTPKNCQQDEVFRVWKNVVQTFWKAKITESDFRKSNDGIRIKLRSTTPTEIIVRTENGETKRWNIEASIWKKIGLMPSQKDMEECVREFKKKMHRAAKASFDALNFRANFDNSVLPEIAEDNATEVVIEEANLLAVPQPE